MDDRRQKYSSSLSASSQMTLYQKDKDFLCLPR